MAEDVMDFPDGSIRLEPVPDHLPPRYFLAVYDGADWLTYLWGEFPDGTRPLWLSSEDVDALVRTLATAAGYALVRPELLSRIRHALGTYAPVAVIAELGDA